MNNYDIKCKLIEEELKTFWPQWHVIRRLGGGAFGDVFEIYRDNFGIREMSALKMIQISDAAETYALFSSAPREAASGSQDGQEKIPEALRNEIQIMEALRGAPNIVTIEDFHLKRDASSTMLFVRMELLTSFQQVMADRQREQSPFTIPEVVKIGRDICTALKYCETRKIIHRDIKPANLFIDGFGNYKVGDFGVSRRMDTVHVALTMTGIGTISYMAPEVFSGRSYNNTVDIYALGLILYQLLNYGRMPFLPKTGSYTVKDIDSANFKRLHGEPLPSLTGIRIGNSTVDASLDAMIRKACAVRSEDRYQSAEAFYEDLTAWGAQQKQLRANVQKRQMGEKKPREDIQMRPLRARVPQEKKEQNIPPLRKNPQPELRSQNASLPMETEQSQASFFSFAKDAHNVGEDTSQNRERDARMDRKARKAVSGSGQSRSSGPKSNGKANRNGQKNKAQDLVIPAILIVVALVGLIGIRNAYDESAASNVITVGPISDSSEESTAYEGMEGPISDRKKEKITTEEDSSDAETEVLSSDELEKYGIYLEPTGTITDSWEEIIAAGEDGSYTEKYHIGDTKELDLGEEGVIRMELVALDADELADGSGIAHMTWIAMDLLNTEHCMNEFHTSEGGWPASNMRAWLRECVFPLIPDNVRSNIKEVIKYSYFDGDTISSNDTVWIPSIRELWDSFDYEDNGPIYFSDTVEYRIDASSASWWWLRSALSNNYFYNVNSDGSSNDFNASNEGGVVVGFCL